MFSSLDLPIEWLPAQGRPEQLLLLLHGWASRPEDLLPLAGALRQQFPQAALLAPQAPHPADAGRRGHQWYSIEGLEDRELWARRVDDVVGALEPWVRAQQQRLGVGQQATALAGFSQGGILSMALAIRNDGLVGRVLSFGGTLTREPDAVPQQTTLHLFHGSDDRIIPVEGSKQALQVFARLQGDATLDIAEGVGHVLHPALIDCALQRLTSHIPQRTWRAALGAVPVAAAGGDA